MSLYGDTAIHKDYQLDLWRYASRNFKENQVFFEFV